MSDNISNYEQSLLQFKVKIADKEFITKDGRHFKNTANVLFYNNLGKIVEIKEYGWVDKSEIYEQISQKKDINLNHCYISDFSLIEYRKINNLSEHSKVHLQNFSAKNTFFDCDVKIDFTYAIFDGDKTSFESSIFGNGFIDFSNSNFGHGQVSFKRTKFGEGGINFQFVEFGEGNITFQYSNFGSGNVSFVNTNFSHGNTDFKNAIFGNGNIDFKYAKFSEGDVSFEKVIFGKGKKDFKNLEFGGGKIDFKRVEFNDGDVSFDGVEFGNGKVSFRSSTFGHGEKTFKETDFGIGEIQFDHVDFGTGKVSFNAAKSDEISFKNCPLNVFMDLHFAECNVIDFSNTVVRDIIDLMPEDNEFHIKGINIVGMRILGRLFIDWRKNNIYNLIYSQKNTSLNQKAEQFRILKENFRNNGQYEDEDSAYLEFKRCESKANLAEQKLKGKVKTISGYIEYYFQRYVFDFVGRYATDPVRVLNNMIIAWFSFSFIYFIFSISPYLEKYGHVVAGGSETVLFSKLSAFNALGNSMYYSGITFFTIGYGDYFAWGLLKPIAVCEGFTGVFLMSYFTVAFVRKILR